MRGIQCSFRLEEISTFLRSEVTAASLDGSERAHGRSETVDAWGRAVVDGRALLLEQASLRAVDPRSR